MKRRTATAARAWLMAGTLLALTAPAIASAASSAAAAADSAPPSLWSRLWRTPDQRGQALLQQGDAAGAARAFTDSQQKAHAALQAHDYTGAAKTLSGIDTAEAQYNRGNALAHTGDLEGAIAAYEAALKHNAHHADARHNRDVVVAALKRKNDKKAESSKQDGQENKDKQSKAEDKAGDKPDGKPGGKDGKSDTKPGDAKDDKPSEKEGVKSEPKPGDMPGRKPSDKPSQIPPVQPAGQTASAPLPGTAKAPATAGSSPKDDAVQAGRDAATALGKGVKATTEAATVPLTEKQIAKEQWLRAIPDDPGGLLRRKFLIEHMLRQQGRKP